MSYRLPERRDSKVSVSFSLALTLVIHAVLIGLVAAPRTPGPVSVAVPEIREHVTMLYVDPQPGPDAPPEPTRRVSTRSSRATQPEVAADRPSGAAFQAGRTPLPTTPRRAAAAGAGAEAPRAEPSPSPPLGAAPPATGGMFPRTDPRLALSPRPAGRGLRAAVPGSPRSLPVPEVDQRITQATAGSSFSLSTTAWEYAPYIARLKARIEAHIAPPPAFFYGIAAWSTRVRFRIERDGRLSALTLLDHRGVENLQHVAVDAVAHAADYEPLPPSFPEAALEITGSFYFNVLPGGAEGGP